MADPVFIAKVRSLPFRQQLALSVILDNFNREDGTRFTVPEFADKAQKFLVSDDTKALARIMGGMLSSLLRNGMVEQFTGGRQPIWQLVSEIHDNAGEYKKALNPVMTHWESSSH